MQSTQALIAFARSRHGVFTTGEAAELGVSRGTLGRLVSGGQIVRCHRAVYRFAVIPVTAPQRIYAAVRGAESARRIAFASHSSAGALLGLPGVSAGRPEVTVTGTSLPVLVGVRAHRTLDIAPGELSVVGGIPVSAGSRAVCECVGRMDVRHRIELIDHAICARLVTRQQLYQRAQRSPGMPGRATILAVTGPDAEGTFWSALERAFSRGVRRYGLPCPRYNVAFRVRGRTRIVDALFNPDVVVELHGLRFHASPRQVEKDAERLNLITEVGLRPLAFTWAQVMYDFEEVARRIQAAIAKAPITEAAITEAR